MRITPIMLALSTFLALSVPAQADPVADKITNYNTVKNRVVKTRINLAALTTGSVRGADAVTPGTQLNQVNSGAITVGSSGGTNLPVLSPVLSTAQLSAAQLTKFNNLNYQPLPIVTPLVQGTDASGRTIKTYSDNQTQSVLGGQWDQSSLKTVLDRASPIDSDWNNQPTGNKIFSTTPTNETTAALVNTPLPSSMTTTAAGLRLQALTNDLTLVQSMINDLYVKYTTDVYKATMTTTDAQGNIQTKAGITSDDFHALEAKTQALLLEIYTMRVAELVATYQEDILALKATNNPKFTDNNTNSTVLQ